MADLDDSLNKISLQDKVKLLSSIKKVREAEIKEKGAKIAKEIEELEEKRRKEMKALEDQLQKEASQLDEEMFKAMDALFFRDRRTYLMNRARLERKQEFLEEATGQAPKGESFLYDISEKIFAGQNLKLQEIITFESYSKRTEEENRGYMSNRENPSEKYMSGEENRNYDSPQGGYQEPNPGNYTSKSKTWLDHFEEGWSQRRNY